MQRALRCDGSWQDGFDSAAIEKNGGAHARGRNQGMRPWSLSDCAVVRLNSSNKFLFGEGFGLQKIIRKLLLKFLSQQKDLTGDKLRGFHLLAVFFQTCCFIILVLKRWLIFNFDLFIPSSSAKCKDASCFCLFHCTEALRVSGSLDELIF